jgi:hypothetical protein
MKTIILFGMIGVIGLMACTKTNNSPNSTDPPDPPSSKYYIKATVNGINVSYTNYTGALNVGPQTAYQLDVYAYDSNTLNADGIRLTFTNISNGNWGLGAGVGVYTDTTNNGISGNLTMQLSGVDYQVVNDSTSTPIICTITAIDSATVTGTFHGTVYYNTTAKAVTNGSFYVAF